MSKRGKMGKNYFVLLAFLLVFLSPAVFATNYPSGCSPKDYVTNVIRMGVTSGVGGFDNYIDDCYKACNTVNPVVSGSSEYWQQYEALSKCTEWRYKREFYYEAALAYVDYMESYLSSSENQQKISSMEDFDSFYYDIMPNEYEESDLLYTGALAGGIQANPYHAYDQALKMYNMQVPQSFIDAEFNSMAGSSSDIEGTTILNSWFPKYNQAQKNIADILNKIKAERTAKPAAEDNSALLEEWDRMSEEKSKILDDIEALCNSIKGCEAKDQRSSDFIDDIINQIINLHDESCKTGRCMSLPIQETVAIVDRVVKWNGRQFDLEKRSVNFMKSQGTEGYTGIISLSNDGIAALRQMGQVAVTAIKVDVGNSLLIKSFSSVQLSEEQLASGIKSFDAKINANQGETVSVTLPKESSVRMVVGVAAKPLKDATMEVTTINEIELNKAVPILGGKGIIGNQDYNILNTPATPPQPNKYKIYEYFKVDTGAVEELFSSVDFTYTINGIAEDETKHANLLRYDESKKEWTELPTKFDSCELGLCSFVSTSPGTSYFAIVVDKETKSFMSYFLRVLFLFAFVYGICFLIKRIKIEKNVKGIKNIFLRILVGTLIVVASLFAALILFIIVFLIGEIAGFATRTSFPDGGTVYLILVTAFYFCFYSLMKFGEKETLLGFGPRFWLISTTTWLVFATITHICLSFSSYLSSNWITLILGLIGGIVGVLIFSKIKKGNQKPGK